ncbi:hypothetical protein GCM10011348_28680 [Marinobacterium nitratireducens]|uniref:Uncharacterized protein n=1 Tax=Marinobacterium nitratireducens TaxID=518897 RepID=A0A917ZKM6_9GAMM|nr:hypothetical protein GCM10011348_28680 [Marinobacterium nitratireducens]
MTCKRTFISATSRVKGKDHLPLARVSRLVTGVQELAHQVDVVADHADGRAQFVAGAALPTDLI